MEKSKSESPFKGFKNWNLNIEELTSKSIGQNLSEAQKLERVILNKLYAIACFSPLTLWALLNSFGQSIFSGMFFYNKMDIYNKYLLASRLFRTYDCAFQNTYEEETKMFGYLLRYQSCVLYLFIKIQKMNLEKELENLKVIDNILTNFFNSFWNLTQDSELKVNKLEEYIFIILFGQMKQAKLIKESDLEYFIRNEVDISNELKNKKLEVNEYE